MVSWMQVIYCEIYLFACLRAQMQDDDSDSQIINDDEVMLSFLYTLSFT